MGAFAEAEELFYRGCDVYTETITCILTMIYNAYD